MVWPPRSGFSSAAIAWSMPAKLRWAAAGSDDAADHHAAADSGEAAQAGAGATGRAGGAQEAGAEKAGAAAGAEADSAGSGKAADAAMAAALPTERVWTTLLCVAAMKGMPEHFLLQACRAPRVCTALRTTPRTNLPHRSPAPPPALHDLPA